ncbi:hypothetical protein GCM10022421_33020 [Oceanisphaera sediminis]|uniref:Secreted protein n=1 Tax=Oceanisphaera sediminis TaxID=981381 RepID=A0ABP7ENM6_9GAMM
MESCVFQCAEHNNSTTGKRCEIAILPLLERYWIAVTVGLIVHSGCYGRNTQQKTEEDTEKQRDAQGMHTKTNAEMRAGCVK